MRIAHFYVWYILFVCLSISRIDAQETEQAELFITQIEQRMPNVFEYSSTLTFIKPQKASVSFAKEVRALPITNFQWEVDNVHASLQLLGAFEGTLIFPRMQRVLCFTIQGCKAGSFFNNRDLDDHTIVSRMSKKPHNIRYQKDDEQVKFAMAYGSVQWGKIFSPRSSCKIYALAGINATYLKQELSVNLSNNDMLIRINRKPLHCIGIGPQCGMHVEWSLSDSLYIQGSLMATLLRSSLRNEDTYEARMMSAPQTFRRKPFLDESLLPSIAAS